MLLTLTKPAAVGHAFNIGNPRSTVTVCNLAKMIHRLVGSSSPIEFVRWNHPDVELRVPAISKAQELLGWQPRFDLEEGCCKPSIGIATPAGCSRQADRLASAPVALARNGGQVAVAVNGDDDPIGVAVSTFATCAAFQEAAENG